MKKYLTGLTILFMLMASGLQAATATINANTTYQTIRGFGASSAWSDWGGNSAGNSWLVSHAADFFTTTTGIGLTMIRSRINPDTNQWGGTAAPLQAARDLGVTDIFATAWTPPAQWKSNGAVDNQNGAYLLTQYYPNYANYLRDYVNYMKNSQNVTISAISPANEPDYQVGYDGCTWSPAQLRDFLKNNLGPTFQAAGLTTQLVIGESFNNNNSYLTTLTADATARSFLFAGATHFYGGGPTACPELATYGKEYWQTEKSNFTNYDGSMTHGLISAEWTHNGLVNAQYNAYFYWWLASDQTNEGLTSVTLGTPKRFYTMGNFSKFVRPGYIRIGATASPATNVLVSAYKNPASSSFVIVAINKNSSASSVTFSLSGINAASFTPHLTSSSVNLAAQAAVNVSGGSFTYSLPAQSVVSFVGSGSAGPTFTPSLTPTPVIKSTWRINAGGSQYTDTLGNVWSADSNFSNGTANSVTNAISNTSDQTLYQSERYGSPFTYSFNVPAGNYQVTLKFADLYQTAAGARVFNVSINGTQVMSNFDIIADSGANYRADDKVFNNISPSGGVITIQVGPASVDNAQVCAIQIIPQPGATNTPTTQVTNTFTRTNTPVTGTATFTPTQGTGNNKQYCFTLDYSAIPADIYKRMITLNVNVGTASSVNVTADGAPITCTYTAATGTVSFSLHQRQTNIMVTAVNWTSGGTGAATKATLWENKKWAYSFTFDDNHAADYTIVYPYWSARNLRGGIGVVTNWIGGGGYLNRTQLDALFNAGWGILNHSTSHPQSTISASNLATYVGAAKTTLESWYPNNYKSIYFIYPYLEMGYKTALSTSGYARGAEGVDGTNYVDTFPADMFNLYRHGMYASVNASQANGWADSAASNSRPVWNIVFTHNTVAGSGTPGTYDTNQATLESHINYVYTTYGDGGATKNMWFAPSDEVLMYLFTRQYLAINTCTVNTPTNTPVVNTPTNTPVTPTMTPTLTPTVVVASTWRINAGGAAYTDTLGNAWAADSNYTSGTARTVTNAITGTTDEVLYQSERYGSPFTYTFTVPAGSYQVTLKFAELYQTTAGSRVFNVSINGAQVLINLDLFTDAGAAYKADDKVFNNIAPAGGKITIQVGPASVDNAQVCAIQIIPQPATPTPTTPVPTNTPITPTATPTTPVPTNTPITPTATPTTPVPTNTPITPSPTPTTPVPTNTPITPSPTPTTPVPTNTPITPSPTPTTPVPTNTPITPSPTPTTPVPTNTPITPTATPTTPVPTNTPITPTATPTTPVPTNTPITPSPTPTTPVPTNTPITPSPTPTTPVPTNTPITPTATPTTPVPTNTPITPTATPTTPVPTNTQVTTPTATPNVSLNFLVKSADTNNNSNSPHPQFRIINTGTGSVNLNNIEARYWFNCDCTGQQIQAYIDWAGKLPQGQTLGSNAQISVVNAARGSQTNYISIRFTGNIILQPNEYVEVQARFNKSDWSPMLQSNDWSYTNSQNWLAFDRVTGYSSGNMIWGQEPPVLTSTVVIADVLTYPNPATSATGAMLQYTINRAGGLSAAAMYEPVYVPDLSTKVYLMIYSSAGRLIWKETLEGVYYVSTGEHRVKWDGKISGGHELAAGTYTFKVLLKEPNGSSQGFSRIIMLK